MIGFEESDDSLYAIIYEYCFCVCVCVSASTFDCQENVNTN
jgi:hypothetical protein